MARPFRIVLMLLIFIGQADAWARPCLGQWLDDQARQAAGALDDLEAIRAAKLRAVSAFEKFRPQQGIEITKRDELGRAVEGRIRVLSGNSKNEIIVASEFNDWGARATAADRLAPVPGTPYFEGTIPLRHGMQYRLQVNGKQILDPASDTLSTAGFVKKITNDPSPFLNSVFWDFDHPGHYKQLYSGVNLSTRARVGGETDIQGLVENWKVAGQKGPKTETDTYRFIAESGVVQWLKDQGYNVIRFGPFNPSVDGGNWRFRYLVLNQFGIESRFGTPEDFARMVDAFHKEGIAVQMDFVAAHTPTSGNTGVRKVDGIGALAWRKENGRPLYGSRTTEWSSTYYDFSNPAIRRHLIDAALLNLKRFRLDALRIDHLDGILNAKGGREFVRELVAELRAYRPDVMIEGEIFEHHAGLEKSLEAGGLGVDTRIHGEFAVFLRNNLTSVTEETDLRELSWALRQPWKDGEPLRVFALTTHDEAANPIWGASGSYPHNLLDGAPASVAEKKIQAFSAVTMFSGSNYVDMPHVRLMQKGNFSHSPQLEWKRLGEAAVQKNAAFFREMGIYFQRERAFAPQNLREEIENHIDHRRKVISLHRYDPISDKHVYVLVNMSHETLNAYEFGLKGAFQGKLRLVLDNDAREFGGSGALLDALKGDGLAVSHARVKVPLVAPYSVSVFETVR